MSAAVFNLIGVAFRLAPPIGGLLVHSVWHQQLSTSESMSSQHEKATNEVSYCFIACRQFLVWINTRELTNCWVDCTVPTTDASLVLAYRHGVPAYYCCQDHKYKQAWLQATIEITRATQIIEIINYESTLVTYDNFIEFYLTKFLNKEKALNNSYYSAAISVSGYMVEVVESQAAASCNC